MLRKANVENAEGVAPALGFAERLVELAFCVDDESPALTEYHRPG